ncbi:type I-E CRISPR-associated protein Cas7/Cse4/CasC [Gleimia hominis]|uniref:Type I-E CRISPR-associated protein Cas7/Cse4/CasC n=1 Tax=Gleimia hominis TaxID=595468 RepID=A0ABU3IBT2_9ACTO|nr:type I-E CRISPR-associated protein Cas7/Cse4/CasC [Gleimia hominis]MDT3766927.1 type I-E CRISPR-associated protein Cas7/Cse4/CasC [Gleimia hominis]
MTTYVDVHALQTVPPSNINRDDTGAPKTAMFGGTTRHRVSSQAWKRAIRKDFNENFDAIKIGTRSRRLPQIIAKKVVDNSGEEWSLDDALEAVKKVFTAAGMKTKTVDRAGNAIEESEYLVFLSSRQIEQIADWIIANPEEKPKKKVVSELFDTNQSIDIALFGRMVADAPDFNVDASSQVAHALGVAPAEQEFDYFTAVDDVTVQEEETGAGMIGTLPMMSSTLYRYATVNADQLAANLADDKEVTGEAIAAFVEAFIRSMPTGKQNTFANRTLPDAVLVAIREDRPISYVNAFEEAIEETGKGIRTEAAARLVKEAQAIEATYDAKPVKSWVIALPDLAEILEPLGETGSRSQVLGQLREALTSLDLGSSEA